ncbi:c-type cytochrome [Neobacillus dielmonensis]|uniref:c-type cytochrome n=1 Tax=Neobacillus dielmonensis TaxID=1347369 RepID=UPI000694EB3F|nr:cytochrome c [Neobacillus dielmonensis]
MKRLWPVLLVTLLLLAGCSAKASEKTSLDGEALYQGKCLACHGADLKGGFGPPVVNISSKYSEQQLKKIITEGTGKMQGQNVNEEETQELTDWLMKQ